MVVYNYTVEHLDGTCLTCDVVFTGPFPLERPTVCCWCGADLPAGEMTWRGEIRTARPTKQTDWFCEACHRHVLDHSWPCSGVTPINHHSYGRLLLFPRRPAKRDEACSWCHRPLNSLDLVRPVGSPSEHHVLVLCPGCELSLREG